MVLMEETHTQVLYQEDREARLLVLEQTDQQEHEVLEVEVEPHK